MNHKIKAPEPALIDEAGISLALPSALNFAQARPSTSAPAKITQPPIEVHHGREPANRQNSANSQPSLFHAQWPYKGVDQRR